MTNQSNSPSESPQNTIIRCIREHDIDAITAMIVEYRLHTNTIDAQQNVEYNQDTVIHAIQKTDIRKQLYLICREKADTTYVCEINGNIVGYINMHICPFPMLMGKELYISDLLIKKNYRGKGIGKKLCKKAEEIARQHGCIRMMLNNAIYAESYSRAFYSKLGFIERENFSNFIKKCSY